MRSPVVLALVVLGAALSLFALWIPAIAVSPAALIVAWVTVARGRAIGASVGVAMGAVLDGISGTPGRWTLALPVAAVLCDGLHRGVLAHPAPGVPALLAAVTAGSATATAGVLAYLIPFLVGAPSFGTGIWRLVLASLFAALEAALAVAAGRALVRLLRRLFGSFLYARQPL
jgi:rod shape-determining protein MreD